MQCGICRHNNRAKAKFCVKCGSKFPEEIVENNERKHKTDENIANQKGFNNNDVIKKLAYVVTDNDIVDEDVLAETVDNILGEMIPYTSTKVMNKRCFKYDIINKITFKDYISKVVSKYEFLTLFLNLLNSITSMQNFGIKLNNLFLDINQIYIEDNTLKVYLVCIPISNRNQDNTLEQLLKEIILKSEFNYNENCKYVKELLAYVSEENTVDIPILQGIVANMLEEEPRVSSIKNQEVRVNTVQNQEVEEECGFTTLLYEDEGESTTILSEIEEEKYYPHLIRKKNDENITVDKPVFRIGKDRNNADYFISDNTAISRRHAEIITKNGEYFIVDKDSTNHVYIDDEMIAPNIEVKIVHENVIRLGNEEFEFEAF